MSKATRWTAAGRTRTNAPELAQQRVLLWSAADYAEALADAGWECRISGDGWQVYGSAWRDGRCVLVESLDAEALWRGLYERCCAQEAADTRGAD